jgi:hypothetical protein
MAKKMSVEEAGYNYWFEQNGRPEDAPTCEDYILRAMEEAGDRSPDRVSFYLSGRAEVSGDRFSGINLTGEQAAAREGQMRGFLKAADGDQQLARQYAEDYAAGYNARIAIG